MAFTNAEKVQIRKFCGYPAYGGVPIPNFGFRYFQAYGDLEFRLVNLSSDEETEVLTNFIPKLTQLQKDTYDVRTNSDTAQAAVWYRNAKELQERNLNYRQWRIWLCDFLGAQYGPQLSNEMGFRIAI